MLWLKCQLYSTVHSRDDTETDSELSDSGPLTRTGSAHSSRKALYTAELFSNSLTPAHRYYLTQCILSSTDYLYTTVAWTCGLPPQLQLGVTAGEETTTHSLRPSSSRNRTPTTGLAIPYHCLPCPSSPLNSDIQEPHISLPNFSKPQEEGARDGREGPRTSVRKSNLKVPSGGVQLVGLSHTARNNAMV